MTKEVNYKETTRAKAFKLWMKEPNPMGTFFKTLDVSNLIKISKKKLKFNILLDSCIDKLRNFLTKESNKWDKEKNWRWPSICYTLEHKIAYIICEHHFTGQYSLRAIFHDWEKPWMYIFPWLDEDEIQVIHRKNSPHHADSGKFLTIPHLVEMYIDWECAPITKPDKPLNAFDTLLHFYPTHIKYILPVCLTFNVKSVKPNVWLHSWHELATNSDKNADIYAEVLDVLKQISNVTYSQEFALTLKKQYNFGKHITQFSPAEIFMLTILWHSEVMKFEIDYNIINKIINDVFTNMKAHTHFTHSQTFDTICDVKNIKPSPYRT